MKKIELFTSSIKAATLTLLLATIVSFLPNQCSADEWFVDGNTVYATLQVGYNSELTQFSGTVAVRMDNVMASGKMKIVTTILSVQPQPGFSYSINKSGGVNGGVDIAFDSATCESRFTFLYKLGLTRIDYGVMRCR